MILSVYSLDVFLSMGPREREETFAELVGEERIVRFHFFPSSSSFLFFLLVSLTDYIEPNRRPAESHLYRPVDLFPPPSAWRVLPIRLYIPHRPSNARRE
jgi:hypothetical protein